MGDNITIDSIQIEIESSSTNAAKGIDALAGSLERLKKSGSFKTVSTNLDHLSTALKNLPNVHGASNSLRTLANSIEKLKSVGSVASLSNSLAKLPAALQSVSNIDLERVAPKVKEIADAVAPLSNIKAGGLSTLVNSLKKLNEVTNSLDDDTINRFASKVELLNSKLSPLSQKMTTIKEGFRAIDSGAKKASKSVDDLDDSMEDLDGGINASALNFSSFIEIARGVIDVLQRAVQAFVNVTEQAIEWDGIAARFGRGFGAQAQETYAWIQRLNEEMGINIQQFMQYSSVYATMLKGFGVAHEDAGKMALGYAELTYDIWAGYNDVYKSFEEAAEAVKSAIAGEVEPVRRAGFTIVEATLEQTAANHGLEISLANATEAQKSYLRYLTLVDQAHAQGLVGTYAKELNTAEGLMRTLSQQLKSLAQAFGSLLLPILVKVVPWVQAFVELLADGVYWLANLFGVDIQPVDFSNYESGAGAIEDVANSAGNATGALNDATKAAKELKNATLGIDELNIISPPSASSSGAGGGGAGGAGDGFAGLDVQSLWDETIFDSIQSDVDEIKEKIKGWLPVIATVSTALAGLRLINLLKDLEKIKSLKAVTFFTDAVAGIKSYINAAKLLAPEVGWMSALFPKLSTAVSGLSGAIAALGGGSLLAGLGIVAAAIVAVASAIYFVVQNWDELKKAVKEFFGENIAPKLEEIGKHFEKIKEALGPVYDKIIKPLIDGIKWLVSDLSWLGTIFEWIGGVVFGLVTGPIAGFINALATFLEGIVQLASGVIQNLRGIFDVIIGIFTLDGERIKKGWDNIWNGCLDVVKGLYDATIGTVKSFTQGVIDWFYKLWDVLVGHSIVPDTINAIVAWFTSLPSKIFGSIEKFVTGIISKFKGLWNQLVTWWNGKTKLKEYTPSIGSIYEKLKERWDNARVWWNDKKTKAKEYTPSIGSIYDKLSARWKNARDWWNKSKGSMSYTPSIGSITDKVKSAWSSAKSWWSKNVGGLSTKLNISVPKLTVNWGEVSALGKTFKYPKSFSVKFAADGGMFDAGSLIWAGERGAEIVANAAGGKTGVMNVQQMQDAVYEGVFSAMVAAMRGQGSGGSSQVIKVYIDGKEVASSVEKAQRERGAGIMGSEVYSY